MIIVADTSALLAAFDQDQPEHLAAAKIMEQEELVISPLVITELDHLVHRRFGFRHAILAMEALNERLVAGYYRLAQLRPLDLVSAHQVREKHEGLRLDLADAMGVVLADRFGTNRVFTLDQRDFRAISPLTSRFDAFHILPADH